MLNKLKSTWWGVSILTIVYFCGISLFVEYVISRESVHPLIVIFTTLGVMGCTYYLISLVVNFIYQNLKQKEKQND
jgi:hypothetical protein